jgi:hypothetical protein
MRREREEQAKGAVREEYMKKKTEKTIGKSLIQVFDRARKGALKSLVSSSYTVE